MADSPIAETAETAETAIPRIRKGPTIAEIALAARVGTATVDRILNGRSGVREPTRQRVLAALTQLANGPVRETNPDPQRRIAFLCESGESFNATLRAAVHEVTATRANLLTSFDAVTTAQVDTIKFANLIERTAAEADGIVIVAREELIINRAIRNVVARGVPVICLTSDLPTSGRTAFVGNDQISAGATAAHIMGQIVGNREGNILLVCSAPYRSQEDRELGFRRVLRSEYPLLTVRERVNSSDNTEIVYRNLLRYIEDHGPPSGIYNVAAGNIGIGRVLSELGLVGKVPFIGHELNANSRQLLETGIMTFVIAHDVLREVEIALDSLLAPRANDQSPLPSYTPVRIYTKYSCT
jgi:LacI family transcriptional regulator